MVVIIYLVWVMLKVKECSPNIYCELLVYSKILVNTAIACLNFFLARSYLKFSNKLICHQQLEVVYIQNFIKLIINFISKIGIKINFYFLL
jgi:hypothetical protein